jgi:hypothetical protein
MSEMVERWPPVLKDAYYAYYAANAEVRAYRSHLHPSKDPEWKPLLQRVAGAQMRYNELRNYYGMLPV